MKLEHWRNIAIVLLIINLILFGTLIWAYSYGTEMYEQEYECAINVCEDYQSYSYDELQEVCSCYDSAGTQQVYRYIGG